MARKVSKAGLDLIKSFEGFSPKWYPDPAHGWKVPTVCYGHTDMAGDPKHAATKGKTFSEAEAVEILANDLGQYAAAVEKSVKVPLNDNQFAALVSFTYNVGAGALAKSTLIKKLNAGNYAAVPSELAKWDKAGGKKLKGLTRRRAAEAALFVKAGSTAPSPAPKPIPVPPASKPAPEPSKGFWAVIAALFKMLMRGGK